MAKRDPKWTGFYVEHEPVDQEVGGPSRTRQEFADECDINNIMRSFEATGVISHVDQRQPVYLDFSAMPDLQSTLYAFDEAQAAFMSLPAVVRKEFENDPVRFVAFAAEPSNVDKMREWGLAKPAPMPDAPLRVEVVNTPAPVNGSQEPPKPA